MVQEKYFESFDLSFFTELSEEVLELVDDISPAIKFVKITGPNFDKGLGQTFDDVIMPFCFLTMLILSHTHVVLSLDFLSLAPLTLKNLQLDFLHMLPAIEFVCYVPILCNQLTTLHLTNNPQLTKYDLVNILQHFAKLEELNICQTEYLTLGTCETIARYCYNLQRYYFNISFSIGKTREWVALLGIDLEHMHFTPDVYRALKLYYDLEQDLDDGHNFDELDFLED